MKNFSLLVSLLIGILFQSSCMFYGKTKVYDEVYGIDSDKTTDNIVNIMIIHGIGRKDTNYANYLISNMCHDLKIEGLNPNHKLWIKNNFNSSLKLKSDSGNIFYLSGKSKETGKVYRFFIIHWSPITYAFKDELENYDMDKRRASLFLKKNKRKIMDDNLSDVAIYMNPDYKDYIQKLVEQAFILMFHDDPEKPSSPIHIISTLNVLSGSFGSRIVLDVFNKNLDWMQKNIHELTADELRTSRYLERLHPGFKKDIEKFLVQQPINFYMLSNQLPLFTVFNSHKVNHDATSLQKDTMNEYEKLYYNIQKSEYNKNNKSDTIHSNRQVSLINKRLIIFNDPNDFLGYRVRKEIFGKDSSGKYIYDVRNVSMRNKPVFIPGLVKLSNPGKAHEKAFDNKDLHKIITKGAGKNRDEWYDATHSF